MDAPNKIRPTYLDRYNNQVFNAAQMAADSLSELIPFAKRMGESPDDAMVGMAEEALRRCETVARMAMRNLYPHIANPHAQHRRRAL